MGFTSDLQNVFDKYREKPALAKASFLEAKAQVDQLVPYNSIQKIIRPIYGKGQESPPSIGDHPDFLHLKGTRSFHYHYITTLFMDIESSTRLSLLYSLEDVFRIKNAFIRVAMEMVKAFDGHVHRIMGDSVMAYFGGKGIKPENSCVDALNCGSLLMYFVNRVVIPKLSNEGYDDPFGIRIGIDFGKEEDVLWGAYGYPNMDEVTATSFYVDVASKLQHSAGRNQIMIGNSIWKFVDFPEELLDYKFIKKDGETIQKLFLEPNHTNNNGQPMNYAQRLLKWKDYLSSSPITILDKEFFFPTGTIVPFIVNAEIYNEMYGSVRENPFFSCSNVLPKQKGIKYIPYIPYNLRYPFEISFIVENHGDDAFNKAGVNRGNHSKSYIIKNPKEQSNIKHWEHTAYRGLHYMIVKFKTQSGILHLAKLGIYIE